MDPSKGDDADILSSCDDAFRNMLLPRAEAAGGNACDLARVATPVYCHAGGGGGGGEDFAAEVV